MTDEERTREEQRSWEEHDRAQLRQFRAMSLCEKLKAVEGMADVVRRLEEMRERGELKTAVDPARERTMSNDRSAASTFAERFSSLTGVSPLRWQTRLFARFIENDVPATCDLPTGLGKTHVVTIWLLALAAQAERGTVKLPRRLAYIVNRRTVVDQATTVVERIRRRMVEPECAEWRQHAETLRTLAKTLNGLAASSGPPLAISTLRGEFADNEEWKSDPARPAIIVGTIDMIGSKLLFSGYGDGRYRRIHHAGLIGQDILIVHDEAHLTPAFSSLLWTVERHQRHASELRPLCMIELSATPGAYDEQDRACTMKLRLGASASGKDSNSFELLTEDDLDQLVGERLDAVKRLHLHMAGDLEDTEGSEGKAKKPEVADKLTHLALKHDGLGARVLVYVRSPNDAQRVANALWKKLGKKAAERVALLTGTMRGCERDQLLQQPPSSEGARVVRHFLDATYPERTVYLVSTSAGEVGIDIDADHMVCDVTTLESLIQRLGRVNRRGGQRREARVDVVWSEEDAELGEKVSAVNKATALTLQILQQWAFESPDGVLVSPRALRDRVEKLSDAERWTAFSPKAVNAPLTDILLDKWSLTSVDELPGRPEVAAYLHGLTADAPQTYVSWRKEVIALHEAQVDFQTLNEWFAVCNIEARERLRDRTSRVKETLGKLLITHRRASEKGQDGLDDLPVVLLDERGRAEWRTLSQVVQNEALLRFRTVVLPVEARGLDQRGMLTVEIELDKGAKSSDSVDVAERDGQRGRRVLHQVGKKYWLSELYAKQRLREELLSDDHRVEFDSARDAAAHFAAEQDMVIERLIPLRQAGEGLEDEGISNYLVLIVPPRQSAIDDPETAKFDQTLDDHTRQIVEHMSRIADALWLCPSAKQEKLKEALVDAARWHDRGKDRSIWQRFACNHAYFERAQLSPLAKSKKFLHGRALGGYRHEFGSLLEASHDELLQNHPERDLVLHLIATHHGWARPHFETRAYDHEGPLDLATGVRRTPTTAENERAAIETLQRFGRLQERFGRWGLAWLESLLRCADIAASKEGVESVPNVCAPAASRAQEINT
jgi:CRISPR-associated endonuclease/helicase Cas3